MAIWGADIVRNGNVEDPPSILRLGLLPALACLVQSLIISEGGWLAVPAQ